MSVIYTLSQAQTRADEKLDHSKWSFASNRSRVDSAALAAARADVDRLTHAGANSSNTQSHGSSSISIVGPSLPSSRAVGPTLPTPADRQLALESTQDLQRNDRKAKLKENYNRADELVPKSGGKEGKMDEKRATNAENRQFRERDMAAGLEVDEGVLMGENEGFKAA